MSGVSSPWESHWQGRIRKTKSRVGRHESLYASQAQDPATYPLKPQKWGVGQPQERNVGPSSTYMEHPTPAPALWLFLLL